MYRLGENLKLIYTKYLLSIFLLLYRREYSQNSGSTCVETDGITAMR